jgi:hypothetical protein
LDGKDFDPQSPNLHQRFTGGDLVYRPKTLPNKQTGCLPQNKTTKQPIVIVINLIV